jgi:hypothetical protein
MQTFILFLFACFIGELVLARQPRRIRYIYLLFLCLVLGIAYFFLNKI